MIYIYLPDYNAAIECQGLQHYMATGGNIYTEEKVEKIQQRDKLKIKQCQEHNICIYYVNYNDDINNKINDTMNILKNN